MENLEWGLKMTVLGMGLVFALLGLLWAMLTVVLMLDKEPKAEVSPQAAMAVWDKRVRMDSSLR